MTGYLESEHSRLCLHFFWGHPIVLFDCILSVFSKTSHCNIPLNSFLFASYSIVKILSCVLHSVRHEQFFTIRTIFNWNSRILARNNRSRSPNRTSLVFASYLFVTFYCITFVITEAFLYWRLPRSSLYGLMADIYFSEQAIPLFYSCQQSFFDDVTAAMLVSPNKEMVAILIPQIDPSRIER